MFDFTIHPNTYQSGNFSGLRPLLEDLWVRNLNTGMGTIYIISGFANFNGGARFYKTFKEHTDNGGRIVAILGGSTSQRLSTKQVVEALLECGAEVYLINRKRILHAKCYGTKTTGGQSAIITSGNFTGPGLSQNIEASVYLHKQTLENSAFDWDDIVKSIFSQNWQIYRCTLDLKAPSWGLLYDETPREQVIDESEQETLIITLMPTDTNRIQSDRGDVKGKGSQYFWLSKDCFDFFPPLTIRNKRGWKGTLSTFININYIDLGTSRKERVTFEAENNLDFRLGTGALRYTKLAQPDDIACLTRIGESNYELRIFPQNSSKHSLLDSYATTFIGHKGKRYGYIDNSSFLNLIS